MMLVDTNVLLDVWERDPHWAAWSVGQLQAHSRVHRLFINPIVYAELSMAFASVTALDKELDHIEIGVQEIPRPALFLAGRAFAQYRARGGNRGMVLADFFIGAHAAVQSCAILTRDGRRYRTYFPKVSLVMPEAR